MTNESKISNGMKTEIKNLEKSSIEISAEISAEKFENYRENAIKKFSEKISVDGFRKGKAPENEILKKVGDMTILEEMAERAIGKAYPEILKENKIDAIGQPQVSITKIAQNSPLEFKITTAIMPEIILSDYKKSAVEIMSKEEKVEVQESEVENVITEIRKQRAQSMTAEKADTNNTDTEAPAGKGQSSKKERGDGERSVLGEQGSNKGESESAESASDQRESAPTGELPELTDDFVQTLGDFKTVAELTEKVRENVLHDKKQKAGQKKRMEVMENIIKESKMEIPEILVESELDKMMSQFEGDIAKMGLKFEKYLEHIKKTREDLRKEWRTDAERNGKVQLILNKIAITENIKAEEKKIGEEVKRLMEHYKDASPERAHDYIETILTNEAVFKFLEEQK